MGFKHQAKTYTLVFDDPELDGLEVRARSVSIGEMRKLGLLGEDSVSDATEQLLRAFSRALISWNLEDENGPVPTTLEALENYPDTDFVLAMVNTWVTAVTGVDEELGKDSDSGRPFLEESIPMEPLSPSLVS